MFYGVKEDAGEDTKNKISNFIKKEIKLDKNFVFESCKRVGPPRKKTDIGRKASSPRPILVKFKDIEDKILVKKESQILKPPFGCSNDLPNAVRRAISTLSREFDTLKEQKKNITIMYPARIVDLDTRETLTEVDVTQFLEDDR